MRSALHFFAAAAAAAVLCGCGESVASKEASERQSAAYRNAEADYKAGRLDEAVEGFRKVVRTVPGAFSAHFQLAVLLQDYKKDYIGAIEHYREYVAMRPGADKSAVAEGRMAVCRKMLANELAPGAGVMPGDTPEESAAKDRRIAAAQNENAKLKKDVAALERRLKAAETRNAELAARLKSAVSGEEPGAAAPAAPQPVRLPTEKELLEDDGDAPRDIAAEARKIGETGESGGDARAASLAEARALLAESEREDAAPSPAAPGGPKPAGGAAANSGASPLPGFGGRKPPALPPRPKTYAVQPGETLQAIALRFYGTRSAWERIREANKAKITTTGHVKAGDVLILP